MEVCTQTRQRRAPLTHSWVAMGTYLPQLQMKEWGDTAWDSILFQPAMASRHITSVKPQTSAHLLPLKSSQETEEVSIEWHSCNGKQQIKNLKEDPIGAPCEFPSRDHRQSKVWLTTQARTDAWHSTRQRCPQGTWKQHCCTSTLLQPG